MAIGKFTSVQGNESDGVVAALPDVPKGAHAARHRVANKMARQIWAVLTTNEDYKSPMPIMAA